MTDKLTTSPVPSKVILDRLKFAIRTQISPEVLATATLHQYEDIVCKHLVLALEAELLAEKLVGESITVKRSKSVPANWWDYLKKEVWYTDLAHDRIMRWVAKRWPIRYRNLDFTVTVRFERYAKFPHATIQLPELGRPVVFEQWGEPVWRIDE